ncbi:hypothetical protein [Acidisoma silvae]|uniref:Uncharacterized protein n=1 Tax=Acidisoma silvae TaxID=2802396 RepID=A0A964E0A2_9PROT|nr:hypothetical protein [Acidisoma silvae]MCB8876959.1 hypothetical protein [Acidisoma silvae]
MAWPTAITVLQRHRESLLLGGLVLSLAAAIVVEAMPSAGTDVPAPPARPRALPRLDTHATDAARPVASWQDKALGRPLFAIDRRPMPIDATPDGSMPRLSGTIRFANTALAIFEIQSVSGDSGIAPTSSKILGVGAEVGGWTIQTVTDERVLLTKDGQVRFLDLAFSREVAKPAISAAAIRVLHGKRTNVFFQP